MTLLAFMLLGLLRPPKEQPYQRVLCMYSTVSNECAPISLAFSLSSNNWVAAEIDCFIHIASTTLYNLRPATAVATIFHAIYNVCCNNNRHMEGNQVIAQEVKSRHDTILWKVFICSTGALSCVPQVNNGNTHWVDEHLWSCVTRCGGSNRLRWPVRKLQMVS